MNFCRGLGNLGTSYPFQHHSPRVYRKPSVSRIQVAASNRDADSAGPKTIRIIHPSGVKEVSILITKQGDFQELLTSYGCSGGMLISSKDSTAATNHKQLVDGQLYEVIPGKRDQKPVAKDIKLLLPNGSVSIFPELRQDDLVRMFGMVGAVGVAPMHSPASNTLLTHVSQLQNGQGYQLFLMSLGQAGLLRRGSERNRLQGQEWSSSGTLKTLAFQRHGSAATYRPLQKKKYMDNNENVLIEIDAGLIVTGNNLGSGLDMYVADHKQTANLAALRDVEARVGKNLRIAIVGSPELAKEAAGVERVHVYLMCDTWDGDSETTWQDLSITAADKFGIHLVRRNGAEYAEQSQYPPAFLSKCYDLNGNIQLL